MSETTCGRPHYATGPNISAFDSTDEVPSDCDLDIRDLWLKDARVLELDLDRPEILDLRLEDCDLSGINATGFIARRIELRGVRLRTMMMVKGQLDDGLITDCPTSDLSFRFSRLRRVVFRDCDLSGADFYNANFEHVTFDGCNLQRASFDGATLKCLALTNCTLTAIRGVSGLKGAQVDASDLPSLAQSLANDAGILIRDA